MHRSPTAPATTTRAGSNREGSMQWHEIIAAMGAVGLKGTAWLASPHRMGVEAP